nr:MAG TPA: hypothetical protein [Bacteriophage sp.]
MDVCSLLYFIYSLHCCHFLAQISRYHAFLLRFNC